MSNHKKIKQIFLYFHFFFLLSVTLNCLEKLNITLFSKMTKDKENSDEFSIFSNQRGILISPIRFLFWNALMLYTSYAIYYLHICIFYYLCLDTFILYTTKFNTCNSSDIFPKKWNLITTNEESCILQIQLKLNTSIWST